MAVLASNAHMNGLIRSISCIALAIVVSTHSTDAAVDFDQKVRPILSEHCFACHGPDATHRKAGLRFDTEVGATVALKSGHRAVVPGDVDASELIRRITHADPAERMPKDKPALDANEIELIRQWIADGAQWSEHWSFVTPLRPALPRVSAEKWTRNAIDRFVMARLDAEGLRPSAEADKHTLIRRVTLDLTGLPPTPQQVEAFVADVSPEAYERVVDRLLASPRYGERMAMVWLDAARYSDTDGYQIDATRTNWPWRDWVIDAYNANMPFDRFTIEQFAGDLLPKATTQQTLATCFHRNHMANGEGGRHAEESRIDYVRDRVNTVGVVWLGLTLTCSQCHDHKFDPVTQADYYALSAFFDSIDESGAAGGGAKPLLKVRSHYVKDGREASDRWLSKKQTQLKAVEAEAMKGFDAWLAGRSELARQGKLKSWHTAAAADLVSTGDVKLAQQDDGTIDVTGPNARHEDYIVTMKPTLGRVSGMRLRVLPGENGKLTLDKDGYIILTNMKVYLRSPGSTQVRNVVIARASADFQSKKSGRVYGPVANVLDDDPRTGWMTQGKDPKEPRTAVFGFEAPITLHEGDELVIELLHRSLKGHVNIRRFAIDLTDEVGTTISRVAATPSDALVAVKGDAAKLTPAQRNELAGQFRAGQSAVLAARTFLKDALDRQNVYKRAAGDLNVQVLADRKSLRKTHILKRGVWDAKGDVVTHAVPPALGAKPKTPPRNRLGLAKWLVDPAHPLTARVTVNRYWQMYFGEGIVRTPEDFGLQGERPTHPALLDWLAVEFVESGWDIKAMQKLIVMSATYRQSSNALPDSIAGDPDNRLLARASRFRLPSWMIRDGALASSGLMSDRLGGPPVFAYQPVGVWADSTMGRFHYEHSVGDDLYRRSIYTFWRRLIAPTSMFDAPKRRVCAVRTVRTNTPLHALALLNDTTYVEAARVLAGRVMRSENETASRIHRIGLRVLGRPFDADDLAELTKLYYDVFDYYKKRPDEANALVRQGETAPAQDLEASQHAAMTVVANAAFNFDEAVTRE